MRATVTTFGQIDGFSLNFFKFMTLEAIERLFFFTSLYSTAWTLLDKHIAAQLLNKLRAFYGTRRFTTAFTTALHISTHQVRRRR
jgi:hypothetical protein